MKINLNPILDLLFIYIFVLFASLEKEINQNKREMYEREMIQREDFLNQKLELQNKMLESEERLKQSQDELADISKQLKTVGKSIQDAFGEMQNFEVVAEKLKSYPKENIEAAIENFIKSNPEDILSFLAVQAEMNERFPPVNLDLCENGRIVVRSSKPFRDEIKIDINPKEASAILEKSSLAKKVRAKIDGLLKKARGNVIAGTVVAIFAQHPNATALERELIIDALEVSNKFSNYEIIPVNMYSMGKTKCESSK